MAEKRPEEDKGTRDSGSFLEHFLEGIDGSDPAGVAASQPQASPSSVVAALVSQYDALSPNPSNPWQYLSLYSNPPSPTSQREYYNQSSAQTASLYSSSSGGNFHRDLAAEWMPEELEQDLVASQAAHDQSVGGASRAPTTNHHDHLRPPGHGVAAEQTGEPADAWFHSSGYLRGSSDLAPSQRRELDSSVTAQSSDHSTSVAKNLDRRDVDARIMRSWMASQDSEGEFPGTEIMDDTPPRPVTPSSPPPSTSDAVATVGSAPSANSIGTPSNTSLSSGLGNEDSDDEECTRLDPTGDGNYSSGKRKTPELLGENSARTPSAAEPKKLSGSLFRRKDPAFAMPRAPRYAIKTRTDVDIMDDGFKWRKYGQKAVKNSPHPRNYYRCTTPQCPVRKRVERSWEDSGLVITTYEGTHTHQTQGFRTPPAPYFGEYRPAGLNSSGYPAELSLAAFSQLRALQHAAQSLPHHHQVPAVPLGQRFPGKDVQRDQSLRRAAQQLLGLHVDPSFVSVKQESFDFTTENFRVLSHFLPFPVATFPLADRIHMMRPWGDSPGTSDLRYTPRGFPSPTTDTDLVRRVLEAEEQGLSLRGDGPSRNVDELAPEADFSSHNGHIQSRLRSRVEVDQRFRSLQRPSSQPTPRPASVRRREPGGSSSDSVVAAGSSSQPLNDDDSLTEMAKP